MRYIYIYIEKEVLTIVNQEKKEELFVFDGKRGLNSREKNVISVILVIFIVFSIGNVGITHQNNGKICAKVIYFDGKCSYNYFDKRCTCENKMAFKAILSSDRTHFLIENVTCLGNFSCENVSLYKPKTLDLQEIGRKSSNFTQNWSKILVFLEPNITK